MKKITKKAFNETAKYVALIDWMTDHKNGFDYFKLDAKNIIEAMDEAAKLFNEHVYLIKIEEKTEIGEDNGGFPAVIYHSILCSRRKARYCTITGDNGEFDIPLAYIPEFDSFEHI